jgi:hypothetical protein
MIPGLTIGVFAVPFVKAEIEKGFASSCSTLGVRLRWLSRILMGPPRRWQHAGQCQLFELVINPKTAKALGLPDVAAVIGDPA